MGAGLVQRGPRQWACDRRFGWRDTSTVDACRAAASNRGPSRHVLVMRCGDGCRHGTLPRIDTTCGSGTRRSRARQPVTPEFEQQTRRDAIGDAVWYRQHRWRLSQLRTDCVLVLPSIRHVGSATGCPVLYGPRPERGVARCGGLARTPDRAGEHDGLYAPALEHLPDGCARRTDGRTGKRAVPG